MYAGFHGFVHAVVFKLIEKLFAFFCKGSSEIMEKAFGDNVETS